MKYIKIFFNTIILIVTIPIIIIVICIIYQMLTTKETIPSFFGYKAFVVMSGSMKPVFDVNDLIISKQKDNYQKGDIISFQDEDKIITHRIISIEDNKYYTKGDNNNTVDGYTTQDKIEGTYCFKIPKVGKIILYLQTPFGLVVAISIPIFLLLIINYLETKNRINYIIEKGE